MDNDNIILEELSNTYEQLNIFYNWYEKIFSGITSDKKLNEALSNIVRATKSDCVLMISIGRGQNLKVISSWTSSIDLEKKLLMELEPKITEIESKLASQSKLSIPLRIDGKEIQTLVVPWKTRRIVHGMFIYVRDSMPYNVSEQILLQNSSVQLGILIDSTSLDATIEKNNQELASILTQDIAEFDRIFGLLENTTNHRCEILSKIGISKDIKVHVVSARDWKVVSSSEIGAENKGVTEIVPSGIVDIVENAEDYDDVLPSGDTIKVESIRNESGDFIGSAVLTCPKDTDDETKANLIGFCKNIMIRESNNDLATSSLSSIYTSRLISMSKLVDSMHPTLSRRLSNINLVLRQMGKALNLSADDLETILTSAKLLDVALIYLDYETLERYLIHGTHTLNSGILRKIHDHPTKSASLLKHLPKLQKCIPVLETHHERWDGLGYPCGLSGEKIPYLARILHLAQSLAFRTENHFTDALDMLREKSELGWLCRQGGRAFDPRLVKSLLTSLGYKAPEDLESRISELENK